jgi:hypothetical protein
MSVEDDECSGRPSTSKTIENLKNNRELIHEDHHWTILELTDAIAIISGAFERAPHCSRCARTHARPCD